MTYKINFTVGYDKKMKLKTYLPKIANSKIYGTVFTDSSIF